MPPSVRAARVHGKRPHAYYSDALPGAERLLHTAQEGAQRFLSLSLGELRGLCHSRHQLGSCHCPLPPACRSTYDRQCSRAKSVTVSQSGFRLAMKDLCSSCSSLLRGFLSVHPVAKQPTRLEGHNFPGRNDKSSARSRMPPDPLLFLVDPKSAEVDNSDRLTFLH